MSPPFGNAPAAVLCFNADIIEVQMRRTTPTLKPGATQGRDVGAGTAFPVSITNHSVTKLAAWGEPSTSSHCSSRLRDVPDPRQSGTLGI